MKILVINNNEWFWWMWLHWRIFTEKLWKFFDDLFVYNEYVNWVANQEFIESFDKIVRYSWYQWERLNFQNADFLKNISKDKNKNILFIFADATLFPKNKIDSINDNFYMVACDSEFSEIQARKAWIKNICWSFQFILNKDFKTTNNRVNSDETYNFLHISSRSLQRVKWVDIILQAFFDWFTAENNVKLNILTNKKEQNHDCLPMYLKKFIDCWRISQLNIIEKFMDHIDVANVYSMCDCYINASRLETLWIPPIESVLFWLDLISVEENWPSEYIHHIQHLPIKWKFSCMQKNVRRNNEKSTWFEPDTSSLKIAMNLCYKKWKYYKREKKDVKFLLEKYNPNKIINKFISIL